MFGGFSFIMIGFVFCMSVIYNRGKELFFIFIEIIFLGSVLKYGKLKIMVIFKNVNF